MTKDKEVKKLTPRVRALLKRLAKIRLRIREPEIKWQNPENSYPRSKLRGISEFSPMGRVLLTSWNSRSKLRSILQAE